MHRMSLANGDPSPPFKRRAWGKGIIHDNIRKSHCYSSSLEGDGGLVDSSSPLGCPLIRELQTARFAVKVVPPVGRGWNDSARPRRTSITSPLRSALGQGSKLSAALSALDNVNRGHASWQSSRSDQGGHAALLQRHLKDSLIKLAISPNSGKREERDHFIAGNRDGTKKREKENRKIKKERASGTLPNRPQSCLSSSEGEAASSCLASPYSSSSE
ncbi:hypothetical protein Cgig2_028598 [Carnegiea gigantea]|uniref:Uncharacterized protein n=1 Tax=Carnegiea gigantea TaxID=171969 RepID=A0A9Q1K6C8_9CARY|nr:hypothetical protein Cgig2_028598 [Carnegiea gigantea]